MATLTRTRELPAQPCASPPDLISFSLDRWSGHSSKSVVDAGKEDWKSVGVLTKKGGEVDKRCKAYRDGKRGGITQDEYGNMHGLDKKAQEIMRRKKEDDLSDMMGRLGW